jgi:hypothetical protein
MYIGKYGLAHAGAAESPSAITVSALTLVDGQGRTRAVLSAPATGAQLVMFDAGGVKRMTLSTSNGGAAQLAFFDAAGRARVSLHNIPLDSGEMQGLALSGTGQRDGLMIYNLSGSAGISVSDDAGHILKKF